MSVCVGFESARLSQKPSKKRVTQSFTFAGFLSPGLTSRCSSSSLCSLCLNRFSVCASGFILMSLFLKNRHIKQHSHPAGSPGGDECSDAPHSTLLHLSAALTGVLFLSLATPPCVSVTLTPLLLLPLSPLLLPNSSTSHFTLRAGPPQHCGVLHACPDFLSSPLCWQSKGSDPLCSSVLLLLCLTPPHPLPQSLVVLFLINLNATVWVQCLCLFFYLFMVLFFFISLFFNRFKKKKRRSMTSCFLAACECPHPASGLFVFLSPATPPTPQK